MRISLALARMPHLIRTKDKIFVLFRYLYLVIYKDSVGQVVVALKWLLWTVRQYETLAGDFTYYILLYKYK